MSITVELDLSEEAAAKAKALGLLEPARLGLLAERELAGDGDARAFFQIARELRAQPGQAMSAEEIQAEVKAVRIERAARAARR